MSGRSASRDRAIMTDGVEEAIQSRANEYVACAPSRVPERTAEETPPDLMGRVLSRLEFEFTTLFRGEPR
jgi:hypothetical protein